MMHQRGIRPFLAAICLVLLLAACGSDDALDAGSGDSTPTSPASPTSEPAASPTTSELSTSIENLTVLDWQLAEIDGTAVPETSIVTLNLAQYTDNLIQGFGDCHSYMAGIEWDETTFRISDGAAGVDAQERACQNMDSGPAQDTAFFDALAEAATYHASDERLALLDADGRTRLTFVPRPAATIDPELTGTTWQFVGPGLIPETEITLAFAPEGINGTDGCNHYGAGFLVADGGRLTIVGGFQTEMACMEPEGVMDQADQYREGLFSATQYRVMGDQLQLLSDNWGAPMLFVRKGSTTLDPALAGRWGLIEANGQPAIPGSLVTLELFVGFVTGSDDCNGFMGSMPLANDGSVSMDFTGYARTAAGCRTDEILAQADLMLAILEDAITYALDGDRLTIRDDSDNELVYGPQEDVLLIDQTWTVPTLYTLLPDGGVQGDGLVEGTEITLTFDANGTVHGNASCNQFSGGYTIDGGSLTITEPLVSTRMLCSDPPGIMEQEATFLDTLQQITRWEIGMNGLSLLTDGGRGLLELNPAQP